MTKEQLEKAWPEVEQRLQMADILLFHTKNDPLRKHIRRTTDSYWNHAAIVFIPKSEMPVGGPLIVEAETTGIEVHQFKKYSDHFDHYDVGVLRYPNLTKEQRLKFVTSFVLNHIDVPYDYPRLFIFGLRSFITPWSPRFFLWLMKRFTNEKRFLCSTFVHKTFHELREHKDFELESSYVEHGDKNLQKEELHTPGDLARGKVFEWVFNKRDKDTK